MSVGGRGGACGWRQRGWGLRSRGSRLPESAVATPATSWRLIQESGSVTVERRGMAVDEGDGGRLAVGKLDGEAQAEVRAGEAQLVLAHLVEEARAVAQDDGDAGDRVPDDVAKAAQAGEGDADLVPVGVEGHVVWACRWRAGAGRRGRSTPE